MQFYVMIFYLYLILIIILIVKEIYVFFFSIKQRLIDILYYYIKYMMVLSKL